MVCEDIEQALEELDKKHAYLQRETFAKRCSHVCSYWRAIALGTARLWTNIICFQDLSPYERLGGLVMRSKEAPLKLAIRMVPPTLGHSEDSPMEVYPDNPLQESTEALWNNGEPGPFVVLILLDILLPHIYRWRVFDLEADRFYHCISALSGAEKFPAIMMLETLSLKCQKPEDYDPSTFPPSDFRDDFTQMDVFLNGLPWLKNLTLWGAHLS
ncbi:hypothetical protein M422DRAFT_55704 [Sphaerobolus stellatus SS14]|uniref:F-box domain-containing protein n=1 Tax=Sphaerobolus stellatus (strain SS14) TaxID=990650 RepID=A0A0C9TW52_SPHS4|nr:hypothetical protein M422DRAFT_55704 [Sphaerobolus stellatus SS14]